METGSSREVEIHRKSSRGDEECAALAGNRSTSWSYQRDDQRRKYVIGIGSSRTKFSTKSGEPVRTPDGVTLIGVLVARGHMLLAWVPGKMLRYYGSSKNIKGAIIDDEMNMHIEDWFLISPENACGIRLHVGLST